jgi:hypothetical protein
MSSKTLLLISGMPISLFPTTLAFDFKDDTNPSNEATVGGEEITPGSRPYLIAIGDGESALFGQYCGGVLSSHPNVSFWRRIVFLPDRQRILFGYLQIGWRLIAMDCRITQV